MASIPSAGDSSVIRCIRWREAVSYLFAVEERKKDEDVDFRACLDAWLCASEAELDERLAQFPKGNRTRRMLTKHRESAWHLRRLCLGALRLTFGKGPSMVSTFATEKWHGYPPVRALTEFVFSRDLSQADESIVNYTRTDTALPECLRKVIVCWEPKPGFWRLADGYHRCVRMYHDGVREVWAYAALCPVAG